MTTVRYVAASQQQIDRWHNEHRQQWRGNHPPNHWRRDPPHDLRRDAGANHGQHQTNFSTGQPLPLFWRSIIYGYTKVPLLDITIRHNGLSRQRRQNRKESDALAIGMAKIPLTRSHRRRTARPR